VTRQCLPCSRCLRPAARAPALELPLGRAAVPTSLALRFRLLSAPPLALTPPCFFASARPHWDCDCDCDCECECAPAPLCLCLSTPLCTVTCARTRTGQSGRTMHCPALPLAPCPRASPWRQTKNKKILRFLCGTLFRAFFSRRAPLFCATPADPRASRCPRVFALPLPLSSLSHPPRRKATTGVSLASILNGLGIGFGHTSRSKEFEFIFV
jgi:hypothetical protein